MANLIYSTRASLDGYIADETGNPDWATPDVRGGGKRVLPSDVCVKLDLLGERPFANGMVHLRDHTRV